MSLHAFVAGIAPPLLDRDQSWRDDTKVTSDNTQVVYVAMQPIVAGSGRACEALRTFVMSALSSSMIFHNVRHRAFMIFRHAGLSGIVDEI